MKNEFPEYLKNYLTPDRIDVVDYLPSSHGQIWPRCIFVGGKGSLEEQIKTILHEVTHLHPNFISYTGGLWQGFLDRNEEIENQITKHAEKIYKTKKDIVDLIKTNLKKAKKYSEN